MKIKIKLILTNFILCGVLQKLLAWFATRRDDVRKMLFIGINCLFFVIVLSVF